MDNNNLYWGLCAGNYVKDFNTDDFTEPSQLQQEGFTVPILQMQNEAQAQ